MTTPTPVPKMRDVVRQPTGEIDTDITAVVEDPDAPHTRWFPWELEPTVEDDVWFRRVIFW